MPKHTYKQAGVDIHEAASFVDAISPWVKATQKKRKLANAFGLFAAGYDLSRYKQPVIFTGCDGVGTKLELLLKHDLLENAGKDLVAMNVNDVLTCGADPILFWITSASTESRRTSWRGSLRECRSTCRTATAFWLAARPLRCQGQCPLT